jgi:hypothetical protein
VWWLQGSVPAEDGALERAKLRVENIHAGLAVGAGAAAVFALWLALRRQQLAERTQQATEYDARRGRSHPRRRRDAAEGERCAAWARAATCASCSLPGLVADQPDI